MDGASVNHEAAETHEAMWTAPALRASTIGNNYTRPWANATAVDGGGDVLLDSSVIPGLRQSSNLGERILPGENPLISYVSGPEMRNAAAHNPRYFVPKALDDLSVMNTQPSSDLRINIRGQ